MTSQRLEDHTCIVSEGRCSAIRGRLKQRSLSAYSAIETCSALHRLEYGQFRVDENDSEEAFSVNAVREQ